MTKIYNRFRQLSRMVSGACSTMEESNNEIQI